MTYSDVGDWKPRRDRELEGALLLLIVLTFGWLLAQLVLNLE